MWSNVNLTSGWPSQAKVRKLSCFKHRPCPCAIFSILFNGLIRIKTCIKYLPHHIIKVLSLLKQFLQCQVLLSFPYADVAFSVLNLRYITKLIYLKTKLTRKLCIPMFSFIVMLKDCSNDEFKCKSDDGEVQFVFVFPFNTFQKWYTFQANRSEIYSKLLFVIP